MDAVGSNIVITMRTGEVMRIIPRLNEVGGVVIFWHLFFKPHHFRWVSSSCTRSVPLPFRKYLFGQSLARAALYLVIYGKDFCAPTRSVQQSLQQGHHAFVMSVPLSVPFQPWFACRMIHTGHRLAVQQHTLPIDKHTTGKLIATSSSGVAMFCVCL